MLLFHVLHTCAKMLFHFLLSWMKLKCTMWIEYWKENFELGYVWICFLYLVMVFSELLPRLPTEGIFEIDNVILRSHNAFQDAQAAQWFWKDNSNQWVPFSLFDSRVIEVLCFCFFFSWSDDFLSRKSRRFFHYNNKCTAATSIFSKLRTLLKLLS